MMERPEVRTLSAVESCFVEIRPLSFTQAIGFWQGVEDYAAKDIFIRSPVRFAAEEVITIFEVNSRFAFFAPFKTTVHYIVRYGRGLENQVFTPELPDELKSIGAKEISATGFMAKIFAEELPRVLLFSPLNYYILGLFALAAVSDGWVKELCNILSASAPGLPSGQQRVLVGMGFSLVPVPFAVLGYFFAKRWAKTARDIKIAQLMLLVLGVSLVILCVKMGQRHL